ncbi:MAG: magnesium/cobalt transporter CorA [Thermodesulfobacteriota bacterium]
MFGFGRGVKKAGLPPGTMVYVGKAAEQPARIDIMDYSDSGVEETRGVSPEQCAMLTRKPDTVTWVNVTGVHDIGLVEAVGKCFGLHPLILEDIVNTQQRAKLEDYNDYLFIVARMFLPANGQEPPRDEQISIILGKGFVLSLQETEGDVFDPVRERIRKAKGRIRGKGADYLCYALLDMIVDNCFRVLEQLGNQVEDLQDRVVEKPDQSLLSEIHALKREVALVRRSVWPMREVLSSLSRDDSGLVDPSLRLYLRDVHDHTVQVAETAEIYSENLAGVFDVYLSSVSNRLNETMRLLTVIATIFIPLTFLAGVYGMNFTYMPELHWRYGYYAFWCAITAIGVFMFAFFKHRKWI